MYKLPLLYVLLLGGLLAGCSGQGESTHKEQAGSSEKTTANAATAMKTILFFGNSLTAGYGLDPSESFPSLIQKKIDSLNLPYKAVNAGLSGETSAAGANRIDWLLRQKIDVFVLELGANDGLRGISPAETKKNLQAIIDKVKAKYPEATLVMAGMEVPPSMGGKYASEFRVIFRQLAEQNNMALVPFLLEGVGGVRTLNQQDGVHPTAEGQKILANNVWEVLQTVL
ncbi:arylesterase [Rufibacter soli]|jgi:acyl-CoA thioesterase I